MFCYPRKHFGAYFIAIMERKNIVLPKRTFKRFMGTGLSFDRPSQAQEGR
jgi:hypothetical protein